MQVSIGLSGLLPLGNQPHNNKFFFEDETESFEKYRDDLVEQLRKFVEDVQGELGLSKV